MADHPTISGHAPHVDDTTAALLYALPDPALLIDVDGTIHAVNAAAVAGSGKPAEELIGTSAYRNVSVIAVELERHIAEVIRSKKPLRTEEVHAGRRFDHALYPIVDKQGTVTQIVAITKDITEERHATEERQRLSKQVNEQARTFGGILSASADLIYVFDRDIRYQYVNLPGARALGLAPQDIVGKTWKELRLPRKYMQGMIARADVVFAIGRPQTEEQEWEGSDGAMLCYEYILTPIFNIRGEVESIVSISRDITERKQIEARLAESERKYHDLVEDSNSIIVEVDASGTITFMNEFGLRFFGYTSDELIGRNAIGTFIPEVESTGRNLRFMVEDLLRAPDRYQKNVNENITKDGSRVWVSWSNRAITDDDERVIGNRAIGNDITALKHAEEALQQAHDELERKVKERTLELQNEIEERKRAEEQLRAASLYSRGLLEASLDSFVTISAEGAITDVNKATEEVTGLSREKLIGTDFSSYFTEPEKVRKGFQQVFIDGTVRDYPLAIRHTLGRITDVLYNATVYRNAAGEIQGVFATAWNITELKRAEENLRRAYDELEQIVEDRTRELQEEIQVRKVTEDELWATTVELQEITEALRRSNKELEQFAYIASHDLQEPLRTVSSSLGLLEKGYRHKLGEEADGFINYAVGGIKQMQQLIKDLLAYSRVTSRGGEFKPVHCDGVIQHAIDNLKTAIEESGTMITLPTQPLPTVMADETQLIQLFQNLIGNAIKFRSGRPPEVQIGAELNTERKRWQFSIKDNGIGMDMQYADKIFTIFQRLHTTEQYAGTGVGLALCKKIVARHGGEIMVESALGKGSTFYFTIPVIKEY